MYDFEFLRPDTLDEAIAALDRDDAMPVAGGQTLLPTLRQRLNAPSRLVSLTAIPGLRGIRREGDMLVIGATTSHVEVAREAGAHFPALAALAGSIGDPAVRNLGTIGGSIANNDPSACYPAAVLASAAAVVTTRREIAAADFFQGLFGTALQPGELVTALRFSIPERAAYAKFAQPASRFALVGVFVAQSGTAARVAVTGASEGGVFRWEAAETALSGDFRPEALAGLTPPATGMIDDLHGSADYRAHLVGVMTRRAVARAAA